MASQGKAEQGIPGRDEAGKGVQNVAGQVRSAQARQFNEGQVKARQGVFRQGKAWLGNAR
jgi:hypothetical protein